MPRLGEAYVRVRADLKDYDADLDRALKRTTDKFEKALNAQLGHRVGRDVGSGLASEIDAALRATTQDFAQEFERSSIGVGQRGGQGLRRGLEDSAGGSFLSGFFKSIGGAITDGLSGLPPQMRVALGTGVVLAAPVILAGVASAVAAGVALGVTGLGVALASQYESVRAGARELMESVRAGLVQSAEPIVGPLLASFGRFDAFFANLQDRLTNIFANAAEFIDPLTSGFLAFIDHVTAGLDILIGESDGMVEAFTQGVVFLGSAIEDVLVDLSELGEDGEHALRDVMFAAADLIVFMGDLLRLSTRLYGAFREMATNTAWWNDAIKILLPPLALAGAFFGDVDEATTGANLSLMRYDETTGRWVSIEEEAIRVTDAQTKALEAQAKAIDDARNAQFAQIDSTIAFRREMRSLAETLKEGKGAFDFQSEKGLNSIEAISDALQAAEKDARDRYIAGELTSEQAQAFYEQEAEEVYLLATAQGVSRDRINEIFGAISDIIALPPAGDKFAALEQGAIDANRALTSLERGYYNYLDALGEAATGQGIGEPASVPGYADGTISDTAHLAMISEGNRREVVLPLTNPRRTRELAAQSGLMGILGGDGGSITNVFIGNEQLDARMFKVSRASQRAQARMMNNTPRMS